MGSLWNRSGLVERYADDLRAAGAKAYFFQGGTTTPLTVFQDSLESSAHTHPVVADANGRWPDVFVPYIVSFDVRVTNAFDSQLTFSSRIPNPNPVDTTVIIPPENQLQTGMIHAEFVSASKVGYVRLNGLTIGNASSSATERANADTSALFAHLWNNLSNTIAPVSGGRGASASGDFGANKNIQLPDMRGATFQGLDDMGNAAALSFAGLTFTTGDAITPGSAIGSNGISLTIANMPAHTHTGTTSLDGGHAHTVSASGSGGTAAAATGISIVGVGDHAHTLAFGTGATLNGNISLFAFVDNVGAGANVTSTAAAGAHSHSVSDPTHAHSFSVSVSGSTSSVANHSHTFTTSSQGSGTVFNNMPISRLVTWFIKL